jgi:DNA-binding MarR family transcriptional regulator
LLQRPPGTAHTRSDHRPLLTPLSQAFVAFTIEVDNEFESWMPHRTAADRGNPAVPGPFLTSLTFWSNYLRHLPDDGCTVRELARRAGDGKSSIASRLHELHRWGYVRVHPGEGNAAERLVTLTKNGTLARECWAPLESVVEDRWSARLGASTIAGLRAELAQLPVGTGLPLGFPILAWDRARGFRAAEPTETPGLSTLLARAILAMAIDFDARSSMSLATTQLLVGILAEPTPIRELPLRAGISKEAIAIEVGRLRRGGLATVSVPGKVVALTRDGATAASEAEVLRDELDGNWSALSRLPDILAAIVTEKLAEGLEPPADGWRARSPYLAQTRATLADPVSALPRFPMVSHRGGYPDGS